jgi:heme/copper-type cytochrome/quinol oxidase subunit 2
MAPQNQPPEQKPSQTPEQRPPKGYGKRPVWQWVLIYLVIAIIVYGVIYLLFIRDSGGSTGTGGY